MFKDRVWLVVVVIALVVFGIWMGFFAPCKFFMGCEVKNVPFRCVELPR